MLPALLVIFMVPALTFMMLKFMAVPMLLNELSDRESVGESGVSMSSLTSVVNESGTEYAYDFEPIVANVSGTLNARYVQAELTVYNRNPELDLLVERNVMRSRDHANTTLGSLTLADYEQKEVKNIVRSSLREGFNHLLRQPLVEDVSLSIVIQ